MKVKVDKKIASNLAAHFCCLDCKDAAYLKAKKALLKFALTSIHANDLQIE
jgi:hypothetical protein